MKKKHHFQNVSHHTTFLLFETQCINLNRLCNITYGTIILSLKFLAQIVTKLFKIAEKSSDFCTICRGNTHIYITILTINNGKL